ncbi:helix-turn-helix domain-containing protein [Paenibacillus ginsengarvi]|nr:AraC family transcriptional regulator [Paenibacillus ginsengarvi]
MNGWGRQTIMYQRYQLKEELEIRKLITFYYKELPRHYDTPGEKHDFWEMVYVDTGEIEIVTDSRTFQLKQGEMVFYKPNEFHGGKALHGTAPNLIIVTFECFAPCMSFFADNSFRLRDEERHILTKLVKEGKASFDPPIHSPTMEYPFRRMDAPFGSDQIIRNYLEILLIELIRYGDTAYRTTTVSTAANEHNAQELADQVIQYMRQHLSAPISIDHLCSQFAISRSKLKMILKARTNMGVRELFNQLKIEQAKLTIREERTSFSEIAERLGYYSVHHFSRQFKQATGMTPTEYTRSVKARSE